MQFVNARKQMKKQAHNWVKHDFGKLLLVYSPLIILTILTRLAQGHGLLTGILFLIGLITSFGIMSVSVHLLRGQVPKVPYLKMSFHDFKQPGAFKSSIMILIRMYWLFILAMLFKTHALIALILIIVWFVRFLQLSMAPYIFADAVANHRQISSEQAIKDSSKLMKGHIKEYFILELSLAGWSILTALPYTLCLFGIYTIPYVQLVIAEYYIYLTQNHPVTSTTAPTNNNPTSTNQPTNPNTPNNPKPKKQHQGFFRSFNAMFHKFDKKPASKPSNNANNTNNLNMGINNNQQNAGLGLNSFNNQSVPNQNQVQTQTQNQNPNPNMANIPGMSNQVSVGTQNNNNMQQPQQQPQMPNMPNMNNNQAQQPQPSQPQMNNQPQQPVQPNVAQQPNPNIQQPQNTNSQPTSPDMAMNSNPDNPVNNSSWSQKIQQISQKYNSQPQPQPQNTNPQPQAKPTQTLTQNPNLANIPGMSNSQQPQQPQMNNQPKPQPKVNPQPQQSQAPQTPQDEMDALAKISRAQGHQN